MAPLFKRYPYLRDNTARSQINLDFSRNKKPLFKKPLFKKPLFKRYLDLGDKFLKYPLNQRRFHVNMMDFEKNLHYE